MRLYYTVNNRKSQSCPFFLFLGCEEWLKNVRQIVGVNARPVIFEGQDRTVVSLVFFGLNADCPRLLHRINRIVEQVQENLGKLAAVGIDLLQSRRKRGFYLDVFQG